jgi:hypothetical protein
MIQEIPDYFWKKVAGIPAGIRLPKMEKWYKEGTTTPTSIVKVEGNGDPLGGGDFRYWCGLPPSQHTAKLGYASCRCCGELFYTKVFRRAHMKEKCGPVLEEAYKVLRRTHECIICLTATNKKVYGLPMCSNECVDEWCYVTTTPQTLRYMIEEDK